MKKDHNKKVTKDSGKKSDKKTRGFLKSVSIAITAVLTASPLINQGISQTDIDSAYNKSKELTSERIVEELNPLIIEPSNKDLGNTVASHSSHSSHVSHGSHQSHSSHSSSS